LSAIRVKEAARDVPHYGIEFAGVDFRLNRRLKKIVNQGGAYVRIGFLGFRLPDIEAIVANWNTVLGLISFFRFAECATHHTAIALPGVCV